MFTHAKMQRQRKQSPTTEKRRRTAFGTPTSGVSAGNHGLHTRRSGRQLAPPSPSTLPHNENSVEIKHAERDWERGSTERDVDPRLDPLHLPNYQKLVLPRETVCGWRFGSTLVRLREAKHIHETRKQKDRGGADMEAQQQQPAVFFRFRFGAETPEKAGNLPPPPLPPTLSDTASAEATPHRRVRPPPPHKNR